MKQAGSSFEVEALVLGIGNVLWADEGFGVRAVEALHDAWEMPAGVELLDGGTQGLNLLEPVLRARRVLVLDAIDFDLAPGTLRVLRDRDVPAWGATKMSLHQQSFHELLSILDLQGRFPQPLLLIGVQPQCLSDFGGSLSAEVRAQLPRTVEMAVEELERWGFGPTPRRKPPAERLNDRSLALEAYESGRPAAEQACRIGDARFLNIRSAIESAAGEGTVR